MNTAAPRVSVIIPVHRGMDRLGAALQALSEQTFDCRDYEVLVVDNGGNPGIEDLLVRLPQCRLVREPVLGSYAARNTGVKYARGNVLAFTDADCIPAADWLARGVAALDREAGIDMIGGRVRLYFRAECPQGLVERYEALTAFPQHYYVADLHFAVTANLLVRRPVLEALQGFDAVLQSGGDRDFGQRARAAGYRLIYDRTIVVDHPARTSMAELVGKTRRVVGGKMAMWQNGKIRFSTRDWFNFVVPPVVWTSRLLFDRDCPWRMSERLVVILVRYVLHFAVLPVRLRVLLG